MSVAVRGLVIFRLDSENTGLADFAPGVGFGETSGGLPVRTKPLLALIFRIRFMAVIPA